jgi:hypothetical protein
MLRHYDWEKDIIDGFKSKLQQYMKFKNDKWDKWVEGILCLHMGVGHLQNP